MFVVLLKFSKNKSKAPDYMDDHNAWINQGFNEGVFQLVGSLQPGLGGAIIAANIEREALESLINEDPFVVEDIVSSEILDISPAKSDPRLDFLHS